MTVTLSWEQFISLSQEFIKISDENNDGWILEGEIHTPGSAFLKKTEILTLNSNAEFKENDYFEEIFIEDNQTISFKEHFKKEYNILYNMSYSVPELYFNAWKNDGSLISLEDIWFNVTKIFPNLLKQNKWQILTQKEHPIKRKPFYHVHPCKTYELLDTFKNSRNPLITWISSVAPLAGLTINNQYAELI